MTPDLELLDAWIDGDREAGETLTRRHFPVVYRFFRSKLEGNIDDLVQATFVGCLEARERFQRTSAFRTYLLGIARNQLLMHLRKQHRRGKVFAPLDTSIRQIIGEDERSPSLAVLQHEEQKLLLRALRHIPLDFQIAVELCYWEGMLPAEIAVVLEIPPGTVRSRLSRARAMLKQKIEELASSPQLRQQTIGSFDEWTKSLGDEVETGPRRD